MRRKQWPRHGGLGLGLGVGGGGVGYLLNDSFLTNKAAGSVHGTAAEPGPGGNRAVIDGVGAGTLSISSNALQIAGEDNYNDPQLSYATGIARAKGRMLLIKKKAAASNPNSGRDGWCTNPAAPYATYKYAMYYAGIDKGLSTISTHPNISLVYDTYFCVILRDAGAYFFAKGGNVFTGWRFIYNYNVGTDATLYPGVSFYSAGKTQLTDFIRVPTMLWTPQPISADAFSLTWPTTDGGGLTGLEAGGSGKTWTTAVGATWSNSGGFAVNAPVAGVEQIGDPGMAGACATEWDCMADWDVGVTAAGKATKVPGAGLAYLTDLTGENAIANRWYRFQGEFVINAGYISPQIGGTAIKALTETINYVGTCKSPGTTKFRLYAPATGAGTVDNVSAKLLTTAELIQVIDNGVTDFYAEIDITAAAGFQAGIVFNYTDANNFEVVYLNRNDNKVYWDQCLLGTYTNINTSAAVTPGAGYKLAVRRIGTSLYYWYNNIYVHNNTIVSGLNTTSQGLFSTGNGATEVKFDNWKLYAVGSGGEYSLLDMFCN